MKSLRGTEIVLLRHLMASTSWAIVVGGGVFLRTGATHFAFFPGLLLSLIASGLAWICWWIGWILIRIASSGWPPKFWDSGRKYEIMMIMLTSLGLTLAVLFAVGRFIDLNLLRR